MQVADIMYVVLECFTYDDHLCIIGMVTSSGHLIIHKAATKLNVYICIHIFLQNAHCFSHLAAIIQYIDDWNDWPHMHNH